MESVLCLVLLATGVATSTLSPLILCFSLISLAAMVGGTFYFLICSWFMYSLILVVLGGVMVIFLYVAMMVVNEKLTTRSIPFFEAIFCGAILLFLMKTKSLPTLSAPSKFEIASIFSESGGPLLVFMAFYLLLVLVVLVKITESFKGSLYTTK